MDNCAVMRFHAAILAALAGSKSQVHALLTFSLDSTAAAALLRWYGSHAVRVRESEDPAQVVSQLTKVFLQPPKPISAEEMQEIRDKFSWTTIVPALYERVLQELHMRRLRGKDEQLQKSLMDQALQY